MKIQNMLFLVVAFALVSVGASFCPQPHRFSLSSQRLQQSFRSKQQQQMPLHLQQQHRRQPYITSSTATSRLSLSLGGAGAEVTWRQWVSLSVCALVLVDVIAGKPVATAILNKVRSPSEQELEEATTYDEDGNAKTSLSNSAAEDLYAFSTAAKKAQLDAMMRKMSGGKERVDVDAIAKQALDRAAGVTSLRSYLDSRKTDWDRINELQRKVDQKLADTEKE